MSLRDEEGFYLQGVCGGPGLSTGVDEAGDKTSSNGRRASRKHGSGTRPPQPAACGQQWASGACLYWPGLPSAASSSSSSLYEADLPAQRAPAEAQAWLPRSYGDPRGSRDPEAPASQGPQAALRLSPGDSATHVQRRHRLSRSRDFDAVYRHGRSVSTRYLVLYWFPRELTDGEPRLGLAVPRSTGGAVVRNRVKRQLREVWRALLPSVAPGHDYVLIARPGLAEASESRGFDWLRERVDEVLTKAARR
jgi:ribonuclease P protein component